MKNDPLPQQTCHQAEAGKLKQPQRQARHDSIRAYATEMAGTGLDLDPALESAGVEHLLEGVTRRK